MTTTARSVPALALVAALLGATACTLDASNQTPTGAPTSTSVTERAPAAATIPSTVTTVLRPTATEIAEIEGLLPTPATAVNPPSPLRWENCGDRLQCGSLDVPLDPADPTGATITPGVGSPAGHRPGHKNRHPDHQPRRPRRIRRRVPRQRRTLQRRDQPPLRHRLLGSPRRRRHRTAAVRVGLRRHVPRPPTSPPATPPGDAALEQSLAAQPSKHAPTRPGRCSGTSEPTLPWRTSKRSGRRSEATRSPTSASPTAPSSGSATPSASPTACGRWCSTASSTQQQDLGDQLVTTAASFDRALADILNACGPDCPIDGRPTAGLPGSRRIGAHHSTPQRRRTKTSRSTPSGWPASPSPTTRNCAPRSTKPSPKASAATEVSSTCSPTGSSTSSTSDRTSRSTASTYPTPPPRADVEALAAASRRRRDGAPRTERAPTSGRSRCPALHWPYRPRPTVEPITAPAAPPILVVGNTGDPVTPFESAQHVAATLEHGHLLTYRGAGHTTYGKDQCADAHIDTYLLDLTLPAESTVCP